MNTFVCKIEIEHAVVERGPFHQLSAMVHGVANSIELGATDGKIRDYKGNSVGHFYVENDD